MVVSAHHAVNAPSTLPPRRLWNPLGEASGVVKKLFVSEGELSVQVVPDHHRVTGG